MIMNRKKCLESIKGFIPHQNDIITIIEMCQLYPYDSWSTWTDHLGNYFKVNKNKKITFFKDPTEKFIITDIFDKAPPLKISRMSNQALIAQSKNKKENFKFIWFLGNDKRLRLITSNTNNEWSKEKSPIKFGIEILRLIIPKLKQRSFQEIPLPKLIEDFPMNLDKAYSTPWPLSQNNGIIKNITGKLYATK